MDVKSGGERGWQCSEGKPWNCLRLAGRMPDLLRVGRACSGCGIVETFSPREDRTRGADGEIKDSEQALSHTANPILALLDLRQNDRR